MSEMIKRALHNMLNPKPVPVAIPEGWALVPLTSSRPQLQARINELEATVARLRAEAKGLEDLI